MNSPVGSYPNPQSVAISTDTSGCDAAEDNRRELQAKGVDYCLASFVDVHGVTKAKMVPIDRFDAMMAGSELFTGAALDGLGQSPSDDELSVRPDLGAVTVLPWEPRVAWCPGYLYYQGSPWPMCSRTVLARQIERARSLGFVFNLGIETEFFLVVTGDGTVSPANPRDQLQKAAYDVIGLLENFSFMDEVVRHIKSLGWDVYSLDHEDANSQFEVDFSYTDCLRMADRFVLFRLMCKNVARRFGYEATFMPKPYADRTGTGAHFNMSLSDVSSGANLFDDPHDARGCAVSKLAYQFIAGVLRHAPAIAAVSAPTVNSYKRLVKTGSMTGQTWAPVYVSYGRNNRTHMLRLPHTSPRIECRVVDGACNPYLAAAMFLAAGLEGIEEGLDPGDPIGDNMYELSDGELRERGVAVLPRTLLEAVDAFEQSGLAKVVCGDDLHQSYTDLKQREWWDYHNTVSRWEIDRYIEFF